MEIFAIFYGFLNFYYGVKNGTFNLNDMKSIKLK